ncbi:MAG: hypothetical protein AAGI38_20415 [Bacteroidota bacterium]
MKFPLGLYLIWFVAIPSITAQAPVESEKEELPYSISDTIPFELTKGNNIKFTTLLNGRDTITLFFDTGGTELVMRREAILQKLTLPDSTKAKIEDGPIAYISDGNSLQLGKRNWDSLSLYSARIGPKETDGHFGWDLFEGRVVELNYDRQLMIIHEKLSEVPEGYTKLKIMYTHTLFSVNGTIKVNGKEYKGPFLFDSGFQRALILDKDLRQEIDFPKDLPVLKEQKLKNSAGDEFINQVVMTDQVCMGTVCMDSVPVLLLNTPNPARFPIHIVGNELLKRFNTIFDFQEGNVFLKPNGLKEVPYADIQ